MKSFDLVDFLIGPLGALGPTDHTLKTTVLDYVRVGKAKQNKTKHRIKSWAEWFKPWLFCALAMRPQSCVLAGAGLGTLCPSHLIFQPSA